VKEKRMRDATRENTDKKNKALLYFGGAKKVKRFSKEQKNYP
jgi:hypothetical protein